MLPALLALGGGIMSGVGSYMQGQQQEAQLDFNARQSEIDGMIAMRNADAQATALRKYGRKLVGTQRTRYSKSGLRMEGTPLEVIAETMENVELDAIAKRQAGRFAQSQANVQAEYQSEMADRASTAGTLGLVSGILGGGASASMFA